MYSIVRVGTFLIIKWIHCFIKLMSIVNQLVEAVFEKKDWLNIENENAPESVI